MLSLCDVAHVLGSACIMLYLPYAAPVLCYISCIDSGLGGLGSSLGGQIGIDFINQVVGVIAVNHSGLRDGLHLGRGAAQAVHADAHQNGSQLGIDLQELSDHGVLVYDGCIVLCHCSTSWKYCTCTAEATARLF